jgi:hypothetical protein
MQCIYLLYPQAETRAWDAIVTRISRSLRPTGQAPAVSTRASGVCGPANDRVGAPPASDRVRLRLALQRPSAARRAVGPALHAGRRPVMASSLGSREKA